MRQKNVTKNNEKCNWYAWKHEKYTKNAICPPQAPKKIGKIKYFGEIINYSPPS